MIFAASWLALSLPPPAPAFEEERGDPTGIAPSFTALRRETTSGALLCSPMSTRHAIGPRCRDYNGPVSLSYKVIDGNGGSVAPTQSFSLAAVNDSRRLA